MRTILLDTATTVKAGRSTSASSANRTYQATVTGTGAVSATVVIEGTNNNVNWLPLATISLTGTESASDGFVSVAAWDSVRANLTAIAGTSAAVSVVMGTV